MRILMLTHEFMPYSGGVATYCSELAAASAAAGHDVTVIAPDYNKDNSKDDELSSFLIKRFSGSVFHMFNIFRLFLIIMKINKSDYDIIHAADWPFVLLLYLAWPVRKIPFIATAHGTDIMVFSNSRLIGIMGARRPYARARRIAANSIFTANLLKSSDPSIPESRIICTHLGVNSWWRQPVGDRCDVLNRFGIDARKKMLLTVARIDERKGHRLVLQAISMLSHEDKADLIYVIVGSIVDLKYYAEIKEIAENCGAMVVFTGRIAQDDVRVRYQCAFLFCMLGVPFKGRVEGFGLVYLEAASQGLPSLASKIGGVPEVIIDNATGFVVDNPSASEIAELLVKILNDPARVASLSAACLEWSKTFTWERCAELTYGD